MPKTPMPHCVSCSKRLDRNADRVRVTKCVWDRMFKNGVVKCRLKAADKICRTCHAGFTVSWNRGYTRRGKRQQLGTEEAQVSPETHDTSIESQNSISSNHSSESSWTDKYGDLETDESSSSSSSSCMSMESELLDAETISPIPCEIDLETGYQSSFNVVSDLLSWTLENGDKETESSESEHSWDSQSDCDVLTGLDLYENDDTRFQFNDAYMSSGSSDSSSKSDSSMSSLNCTISEEESSVLGDNQSQPLDDHHIEVDVENTSSISIQSSITSTHDGLISTCGNNQSLPIEDLQVKTGQTFLPLQKAAQSQSKCFICHSKQGRSRVPTSIIQDVWMQLQIYVSYSKCRICPSHIENGKLLEDQMKNIVAVSEGTYVPFAEFSNFLTTLSETAKNSRNAVVDFGDHSHYTNKDYQLLLGISKSNFSNMLSYCKGKIKSSTQRSFRNALAMFLIKLRLNLSQYVIAWLFGIQGSNRQVTVSKTLASVAETLNTCFSPHHIGFTHKSRDQFLHDHGRESRLILGMSDKKVLMAAADGTYLYTQCPSDFELQKELYCVHKHRNLVKPMMVVFMDGYIVSAGNLYKSDGGNNDSAILSHMMKNAGPEGMLVLFQADDILVLDRGFRDCMGEVAYNELNALMPNLLNKNQKQFTTEEANDSRMVTMMRWVVESANGRVKNVFKFFAGTIPNSYIPKLSTWFNVACAIINAYFPPLFTETEESLRFASMAVERRCVNNDLQARVERENLKTKSVKQWTKATAISVPTFPKLSIAEIQNLTLGSYQIYLAPAYVQLHKVNSSYNILLHKEDACLLRVRLESRFTKRKLHDLWITFLPDGSGENAITCWYCDCKSGARVVGVCAHVTSVIWYLSYARHNPNTVKRKPSLGQNLLDACKKRQAARDMEAEDEENSDSDSDVDSVDANYSSSDTDD